jgi:large subunit ribosomal protein L24
MKKRKIKKNDMVYVAAGKDKGSRGRVLAVFPQTDRVLVEHVNMVKKHQRQRGQQGEHGIVSQEAALHISNLRCIDAKTQKPTRVKIKVGEDGKRERVSVEGNPILTAR